ncbi:MAG: hypothetical protein F4Z82_21740 [Caldilineaceae bacterium SB0668_bin_21]|nr:hypothetical protein [Caldilineaceae bacterium SB0668_bin_21]MYB83343.1 hypothetical protein [Chloroflexota bacterium]
MTTHDTEQPISQFVWMRREWKLKENPFPTEAIARLGGSDVRENGLLFAPAVQEDKVREAIDKFVLGSAFGGLKFGYLWSLGIGLNGDARGFGKSSLMQYLVEETNKDFGQTVFAASGLSAADADENPVCAVLASFDMATARSLNAVFFEAARYACRFRTAEDQPTLAERIRDRLVDRTGSDSKVALVAAANAVQGKLRGRTLGPPMHEFLDLLCAGDSLALESYVDGVTPARRTRNGAMYLATLLLTIQAAGVNRVILCCDQLEDFAATTTTRQKRSLETERFRDYVLELQPMSDMLTCVVTMHPRATQAIGDMWRLADLPSYDHDRAENRHRIVILEKVQGVDKTRILLKRYLDAARSEPSLEGSDVHPFDDDAVDVLLHRSDGKPRDLLRKANSLIFEGARQNWDVITGDRAAALLDTFGDADEDGFGGPIEASAVSPDWSGVN